MARFLVFIIFFRILSDFQARFTQLFRIIILINCVCMDYLLFINRFTVTTNFKVLWSLNNDNERINMQFWFAPALEASDKMKGSRPQLPALPSLTPRGTSLSPLGYLSGMELLFWELLCGVLSLPELYSPRLRFLKNGRHPELGSGSGGRSSLKSGLGVLFGPKILSSYWKYSSSFIFHQKLFV